jgi:ubiquinone/menaquinone biosynthesis C-methylase UbiE
METTQMTFNGSIPQAYEEYLGSFLFEPFALDLVQRIGDAKVKNILELACGTGRVTRHLQAYLEESVVLTATDINPDMLTIARQKISADNILWDVADMADMAYPDDFFDLVVCQFGLMLVPDKEKALREIIRVLKKDGRLLFNVWGDSKENGIWSIGMKVISSFLGENPIPQNIGPFSMTDENETLELLQRSKFRDIKVDSVKRTGIIESAAIAAKGFIEGLPIAKILMQRDQSLIYKIEEVLAKELIVQLGDKPMHSPLQAWVFEAVK